jgi:hypothetical protein
MWNSVLIRMNKLLVSLSKAQKLFCIFLQKMVRIYSIQPVYREADQCY